MNNPEPASLAPAQPPEGIQPAAQETDWPFSISELTAGLRRHSGDPALKILSIQTQEIDQRRPAVGKLCGLQVIAMGKTGQQIFNLVLKQTQGSTRAGAAGAGLREKSIYQTLKEHLPLQLPVLICAHPKGEWIVLAQLPPGRRPEKWSAADYLLGVEQLAVLHDRFWGLDTHLRAYSWLEQPVRADRDIYLQAARADAKKLSQNGSSLLKQQTDILSVTQKIIAHLDQVTDTLQQSPATLLHGDYWPGNILIETNSRLTVFDWEDAAIGPAVLDLLSFLQGSCWHFSPLPISAEDITAHYRTRLAQAGAHSYSQRDFERLWDSAVMWTFVSRWVGTLAKIPDALLPMRLAALEEVLLYPLRQAISRQLK